MQLYSLNMFRAVAIVLVVLGHAQRVGAVTLDTILESVVWNVFTGATTLFVFISGFLFHHVFMRKFDFGAFFTKKLKNLLIPYLVLSFAAIAIGCSVETAERDDGWLGQLTLGVHLLSAGHAATSYWYIPFVVSLFAMAPLHARFTELSMRRQLAVMGILLAAALLIHRPPMNVGAIQNLIYYTPIYLIGMFCSQHRTVVYPLLAGRDWILLAAALGLAFLQTLLGMTGNYAKPMFEFAGIDVMLLQKLFLCLFLLSFLHRFEGWRSKVVDVVAETSFAIFFLHPLFIELYVDSPYVASFLLRESWAQYFVVSLLCVAISAGVALGMRRVFAERSRLLTGY